MGWLMVSFFGKKKVGTFRLNYESEKAEYEDIINNPRYLVEDRFTEFTYDKFGKPIITI